MTGGAPLEVEPHPLLAASWFTTSFPAPLGTLDARGVFAHVALDQREAGAPLTRDEDVRGAVRDLLRHGGYKPTGRGKPSAEYLVRAVGEGKLASINVAVDACNAASLASGLPISVVDLDHASPPFTIRIAPAGTRYVFNPSGQEIDASGLVCLFDADGPCANAVKDAQRTKTSDATVRTLSVLWAARGMEQRRDATERWYRELLASVGAETA